MAAMTMTAMTPMTIATMMTTEMVVATSSHRKSLPFQIRDAEQ
jgi:hypothetical protein